MNSFRGEVMLKDDRAKALQQIIRDKIGDMVGARPKKQCSICFHWQLPSSFKRGEDVCEACRDDDGVDDLWAQWRVDRGV